MEQSPISPNSLDKQRQIIDAAKRVLVRDGLDACTARAIADASPLTKSAIHYYFDSVEKIVDEAMTALLDEALEHMRQSGTRAADPADRFLAMAQDYLHTFAEPPGYAVLWLAYWAQVAQQGRTDTIRRFQSAISEMLAEALRDAGVEDPQVGARAAFSYLVGATIRMEADPATFDQVISELSRLCGIRIPDSRDASATIQKTDNERVEPGAALTE